MKKLSKLQKELKRTSRIYYLELFLIALLMCSCIYLGYQLKGSNINPLKQVSKPEETEIQMSLTCSNLNLKSTADCLVNQIRPFYNYTISPRDEIMTLEQLKTIGGDCKDYSALYARLIDNIPNYFERTFIVDADDVSAHMFATISNKEGYCILDEANYVCFSFSNGGL